MLGEYKLMTIASKFDVAGLSELIRELNGKKATYGFAYGLFLETVEEMVSLFARLEKNEPGLDREAAIRKLHECRAKLPEVLGHVCESQGYSLEEFQHYLDDSQNFEQEEWEELQSVRRQVEGRVLQSSPSAFEWLKVRKNKTKIKN
jgi:hypothetical protein